MSRGAAAGVSRSAGAMIEVTPGTLLGGYWRESELPLASLLFVFPLVLCYEVGTRFTAAGVADGSQQQIIASLLLRELFGLFGAHGRYLPGLAIFVILFASHILRRDRWMVRWETLLGMALESVALAIPVMVLGFALSHYFPLQATAGSAITDALALAVGAGVYEEVVFRLILLTLLSLILRDAFGMTRIAAGGLMIFTSGVLFSAYHYLSPYESFSFHTFTFRGLAGVYFAVLFLVRGFGVTAGSHAAYDVIIVSLLARQ
jgi:membrane protease YdiL (CAAX protease family)